MEQARTQSDPSRGRWWRLPLLLCLVLIAIVVWRVIRIWDGQPAEKNHSGAAMIADPHRSVSLEINFGDGRRERFEQLTWHDGMTVADLMNQMPKMLITQKGSGVSAFLSAIYGVENQGAGSKNWTYSVNGRTADRSIGVYKLQPGDQVLWTFGPGQ